MTIYAALAEAAEDVIAVTDATSINPTLPVAYLGVLATTTLKYGHETSALLSVGAKTKEELETLVAGLKTALGSSVTASDGTHLERIVWNPQEPVKMLDATWGQRINLKVLHWEA